MSERRRRGVVSAAVSRREVKRRWSQRCGQETSTPGGSRRDLVVGAWKGLAAMAMAMAMGRGARDDAQGVTQTAVKSCVSCVLLRVLCCAVLCCAVCAPTTLESLHPEGGLTIKHAGARSTRYSTQDQGLGTVSSVSPAIAATVETCALDGDGPGALGRERSGNHHASRHGRHTDED